MDVDIVPPTHRELVQQVALLLGLDPEAHPQAVLQVLMSVVLAIRKSGCGDEGDGCGDDGTDDDAAAYSHLPSDTRPRRRAAFEILKQLKKEIPMDPEKAFAAVAKALGLDEDASSEQVVAKIQAIVDFLAADAEPEAPPAAGPEAAPAAAASVDVTKAVAASDEPAEVVELADPALVEDAPTEDPATGEFQALLGQLTEATGMDEASLLASLREQLDAVAALLSGQPADGAAAEEAGMARTAALSASKATQDALKAKLTAAATSATKLTARIAELEAGADERLIDDAIAAGHILVKDRGVFTRLSRSDRAGFRAELTNAAGAPAVPTGDIVTALGSAPDVTDVEPGGEVDDHPDVVRLTASLTSAKLLNTKAGKKALAAARAKAATN